MREIKFRGRQLLEHSGMNDTAGKWLYGYAVIESTQTLMYWQEGGRIRCERVAPETVGQYTGLLDRNGVEIYEGDIYTVWSNLNKENVGIYVVEWTRAGFGPIANEHLLEVIGNIYENAELLQNTKETTL